MFSLGMAMPFFNNVFPLASWERYIFYFFTFSRSFITQLAGLIALFFLFRLIAVFVYSKKFWNKKKKNNLSLEEVKKLAKEKGQEMPFFTIFIPARNEAAVIKKTIFKISQLDYPQEKMEIVVITDEKERLNKKPGEKTTQEIVEETKIILKKEKPNLLFWHLEVPDNFSGEINGLNLEGSVPSTKGRALNYALSKFDYSDFSAFFDTDDHPDKNCLLAVARENLNNPKETLFQLPVFQCRNFWAISTFSKIAALGQSFTHEVFLPWVLGWLPFLGGTNLFIKTDMLIRAGGFSFKSITEDLELGIRLYLKEKAWPKFLSFPSSEQTPATISAYFRQRKRWALGQLNVIQELKLMSKNNPNDKRIKILFWKLLFYGPAEWLIYFSITLVSSFVLLSRLIKSIFVLINLHNLSFNLFASQLAREIMTTVFSLIAIPLTIISLFFLYRYRNYLAEKISVKKIPHILFMIFESLFVIPFILFIYPLPFVLALFNYGKTAKKKEVVWIKTPRTAEI